MKAHPPANLETQQREALARWKGCLDRIAALPHDIALHKVGKMSSNHCEGHRRDVLMTFPASIEKELDNMLRERSHDQVLHSTAAQWHR